MTDKIFPFKCAHCGSEYAAVQGGKCSVCGRIVCSQHLKIVKDKASKEITAYCVSCYKELPVGSYKNSGHQILFTLAVMCEFLIFSAFALFISIFISDSGWLPKKKLLIGAIVGLVLLVSMLLSINATGKKLLLPFQKIYSKLGVIFSTTVWVLIFVTFATDTFDLWDDPPILIQVIFFIIVLILFPGFVVLGLWWQTVGGMHPPGLGLIAGLVVNLVAWFFYAYFIVKWVRRRKNRKLKGYNQ